MARRGAAEIPPRILYRIAWCDVHGESEHGPYYNGDGLVVEGCLRCAFEGKVFAKPETVAP